MPKCERIERDLTDLVGALALPVRVVRRPNRWKHERDRSGQTAIPISTPRGAIHCRPSPIAPSLATNEQKPFPNLPFSCREKCGAGNRSRKSPKAGFYVKREKVISL